MSPASRSSSGVTTVPSSNRSASVSRLTTAYSVRKLLWNPRFGTRRCSGIWPPSKPRLNLKPERDCAPLCPRPAVLPLPEPWPRPTRKCFLPLEPSAGLSLSRPMVLVPFDRHEVTDLQHHPARRGRVKERHGMTDAPQPEALDDLHLLVVTADGALHERDLQFLLISH